MPEPFQDHRTLVGAISKGGWESHVTPLTEEQLAKALEVVKANALNESDYELLAEMIGLTQ